MAGVSVIALALPALAAELSPGGGAPWELDTAGTFTINGADTSAENAWIGFNTPGVVLAIDGTAGPASLTISSGKSFHLGINSTASGEVTTLTGSSLTNTASLIVGDQVFVGEGSSNNTMTLNAFSTITASSVVLGVNAGSDNNLLELLTGTSTIELTDNLIVGYTGKTNAVTLANGASIHAAGQVVMGYNDGAQKNDLTVSSGASVTADLGTVLGYGEGGNSLLIQSGGTFTTYTTTLGWMSGAGGNSVLVTGAGSTYTGTTNASFNLGDGSGVNALMVADGAVFDIGDRLALGKTIDSNDNIVTVTGAGSELHAGNVRIGITTSGSSGNSLVVSEGGYVQIDTDIKVRAGNSIDLSSGAVLDMAGFTTDDGATIKVGVDASRPIDFNVTGAANLSGTLLASPTAGGSLSNRYRVLSSGGLSNFLALDGASDFGPNITVTLDYEGNDLYLYFAVSLPMGTLGQNQANLASAVTGAFGGGANLSGGLVDLFGIPEPDLNAALSGLTGEINAFTQTELGWSGTEGALGMLAGPDLCAPVDAGRTCVRAFASGGVATIAGDAVAGSHDASQANGTLGLASATLLAPDTQVSGLLTIGQSRADVSGLGVANVTDLRFGANIRRNWQAFHASLAATGGLGMGQVSRSFSSATPGSATADVLQAYLGARGEIGVDLALGDAAVLTPFAALDWANTTTGAYTETGAGQYADLALGYDGGSHARTSAELGLRLASAPSATGLTIAGMVAYRHVLTADNAVQTHFASLGAYPFAVTPATTPPDLLKLSADASLPVGPGASLTGRIDAGFGAGYQSLSGKVGLTGHW